MFLYGSCLVNSPVLYFNLCVSVIQLCTSLDFALYKLPSYLIDGKTAILYGMASLYKCVFIMCFYRKNSLLVYIFAGG